MYILGIVNHEVNNTSEDILILADVGTRTGQSHKQIMHIGSNIDDYKYSFYPRTITECNKLPSTTINSPSVETLKDRLKAVPPTMD